MISLALVMCIAGFLIGVLPDLPLAFPYWLLIALLTLAYPLALSRTLRANRADYEFRMLHWLPFIMSILWIAFQFLGPKARILKIFQMGFFFLWSLPLVAVGIAFLIIFSVHVIRRRRIRIIVLSLFLALFTIGAVTSEAMGFDYHIRRTIYPEYPKLMATVQDTVHNLRTAIATLTGTAAETSSSSRSSSSVRSVIAITTSSAAMNTASSLSSVRPTKLPASGPEAAGMLAATLLGLYMASVHMRAKKRV